MLIEKYSKKISHSLLPIELIRPYPSAGDRLSWNNVNEKVKSLLLERVMKYEDIQLKPLRYTALLDSFTSGSDSECIELYNTKKNSLIAFTLAACISNDDSYIKKALNMAWSIMDMAIWHLPGNSSQLKSTERVTRDITNPILDTSSTEFGYLLTYTYYLLKSKFDEIDINIGKRFKFEIEKRIMALFFETHETLWQNNSGQLYDWTPYCMSNVLWPFLIFEENYEVRHAAIKKSLAIMDTFINAHSNDKRNIIFSSMTQYSNTLYIATDGVFDLFSLGVIPLENEPKASPALLKYIQYTSNTELLKPAYSKQSGEEYINLLQDDTSIDSSLFIIFNSDLIINKFYLSEGEV